MSKRQQLKEKRRRQNQISRLLWGAGIIILVAMLGYFIWSSASTPANPATTATPSVTLPAPADMLGEAVPVGPDDRTHIDEGTDPGQYSSNPPTAGHHYPTWLDAGFYDTNTRQYPQGYLVHNLEHGYVIFWYNCKILSDSQCSEMKTQIKAVMAEAGNLKVIAYPWDSIDVPLVMTSWGYRLRFDKFDPALASTFIQQHRNRAPEPDAP